WDESIWEPAKNVVFNKSQKVVRKFHMRSHLRTLQKELKGFNELLNKSGFGWDYIKNTVIQSTTCWDKLLSDKKDADKYKSFQFLDTKDIDDVYDPDMSGLVDEDEHLGDIEENPSIPLTDSTRKRSTPAPPLEKQQHGTKPSVTICEKLYSVQLLVTKSVISGEMILEDLGMLEV
ncbi:hypothetical protein GIB67_002915, partial [Kingdonia uniflora]